MIRKYWDKLNNWYVKLERPISSISLIGGFVFDAMTLKRVDLFWENLWIGAHLLMAAAGIIILNRYDIRRQKRLARGPSSVADIEYREKEDKWHFWLLVFIQFAFGGLFSTFLVFYFRSATLAASWPFLLILAAVFILNESFKKHYARLTFQISVFFISLYAFAIYIVPVVMHRIGDVVFLISGGLSLAALFFFLGELKLASGEKFKEDGASSLAVSIITIILVVNGLYFAGLIPPIPLSLKDAAVLHAISRDAQVQAESGGVNIYDVASEPMTRREKIEHYLLSNEVYHAAPGESVFVYAAVFSPTNLNTKIVHEWQRYVVKEKLVNGKIVQDGTWTTVSKIPMSIVGGRDGGYRSWSEKTVPEEGRWRVNILSENGRTIGRVGFTVDRVDAPVPTEKGVR